MTPIPANASISQAGAQLTTMSVIGGQLQRIKNNQKTTDKTKLTTGLRVSEEVIQVISRKAPALS